MTNKTIQKLLVFIFLAGLLFSVFNIGKVLANNEVFKLIDAKIEEKSDSVDANIVSFDKNSIKADTTFHNLNEYVIYKLTIKNDDDKKYTIKSINDDNKNQYLKYEYESHENEELKSYEEKEILIKLVYKNEIENISKRLQKNTVKFTILLEDEEKREVPTDIIVNPVTIDKIGIYLITTILSLMGLIVIVRYKNKRLKKMLVLLLLIPTLIKALSYTFIITIDNNVNIMDRVSVKYNRLSISWTEVIKYNSKATEPTDNDVDGYTFNGWYEYDNLYNFNLNVTDDLILDAKYDLITYRITYNLDGGEVETPNKETYTVETETFDLNNPTKDGYNFSGWTGSNGDTLQTRVSVVTGTTGDLTFNAHYSESENTNYKVIHKYRKLDNSFEEEVENLTGVTGSTVRPAVKPRRGFVSPELKDLVIKADGTSTIEYIYERELYTLTLVDPENMNTETPSGRYPFETPIEISSIEKEGYSFDKWNINNESISDKTAQSISFTMENDTEVSTSYNINTYTVTFNANGGSWSGMNTKEERVNYNNKVSPPINPIREGYILINWYSDQSLTTLFDFDNYLVKSNITIYAKWKKVIQIPESPADKEYNGNNQVSGITCPEGSSQGGDISKKNVGNYVQTCSINQEEYVWNDNTSDTKSIGWKIVPKSINISWGTSSFVYDSNEHILTATASTNIEDEVMNLNITNNTILTVGSQTAISTCNNVNNNEESCNNYILNNNTKNLVVTKKALTIKANAQEISYGNSISNTTNDVVVTGLVGNDVLNNITLTPSTTSITNNGYITPSNAVIKRNNVDVSNCYNISYSTGTLKIKTSSMTCENTKGVIINQEMCTNNQNIVVNNNTVCKRATTLHQELCCSASTNPNEYCPAGGYHTNDKITYGSCGTNGELHSGDAFTCDVNNDGTFDELTERFYYVSDYFNTTTKEFENDTAVLIYYNNVVNGSPNDESTGIDYDDSGWIINGPRVATTHLSTNWTNTSLKNNQRTIINQEYGDILNYSYGNYTSRLLTIHELKEACNLTRSLDSGSAMPGELNVCNYLLENTVYARKNTENYSLSESYWLETPSTGRGRMAFTVSPTYQMLSSSMVTLNGDYSGYYKIDVRPVIEVSKSRMEYGASVNSVEGSVSKVVNKVKIYKYSKNILLVLIILLTLLGLITIRKRKNH